MLGALDVILVRHADSGQAAMQAYGEDVRPLSDAGRAAAEELADELEPYVFTAVYSSPDPSSVGTVAPTASRRGLPVQLLDDLRERRLSESQLDDWRAHLELAWADADYAPTGGETGREAQRRVSGVLDLLRSRHPDGGRLLVGSHGNLISLILQALEPGVDFGFQERMPMPAVYRLTHDGIGWRVMGGHGFRPIALDS